MRQALADQNLAGVLALLRSTVGLTQQEMADLVPGWTKTKVTRIESGERGTMYDIRELLAWADAVCMPREALLPLITGRPDADLGVLPTPGDEMDRRTFNGALAALSASALLPGVFAAPERISQAHITYLQTCSDELWTRDWVVGGAALLRQAMRLLGQARAMLDESDYTERIGSDLLRVAASIATCSSFLAFDAGQLALARRIVQEAASLADGSEDPALRAHAYATMALQSTALARMSGKKGPAREAQRALRMAERAAKHHPSPRVHALINMRKATANALLNDETAARAALLAAHDELDRGDHPDDPMPLAFVTRTEVLAHEGCVAADLGKPGKAVRLYTDVVTDPDLAPRNRVYYRATLAGKQLAADDVCGALTSGSTTLDEAEGTVASPRSLNLLRPLAAHDSDFRERLATVAAKLSATVPSSP
ncbi:helix-turn-helix domain-containing protein [Spirillospora albida]|uniref:helix-turn-helix domain-containing protein n=1 Tax=Spirillospora albida TaxID=58123 RepID=UPI00068BFDEC|nr:helix-turn-helix transcriptional regulator [Spirillospora albida]